MLGVQSRLPLKIGRKLDYVWDYCGIMKGNIVQDLISCLKKLEYRGYDSAGLACFENSRIERYRSVGRVSELEKL